MISGIKKIDSQKIRESGWNYEPIYNLIFNEKDSVKSYQTIVGEYSTSVDEVMTSLGSEFIKWIIENKPQHVKIIPGVMVLVASHQAQRIQVIDPVVSLLSLIFQIQKMID